MTVPTLITILTFVAALLVFIGVYSIASDLYLRDRARVRERIREETRHRGAHRISRSGLFKAGDGEQAAILPGSPARRIERMIEQSGLKVTPRQLWLMAGLVGGILGMLTGILSGNVLLGAFVAFLAAGFPFAAVRVVQKRRQAALLAQLPDAFDLVARVIRAGKTVPQAMRAVADEFPPPLAAEFTHCTEQQDLGLPPELALRDLAERTGLLEMQIFVVALLVQRQAGGNLAEILENLAGIVRDRFRVREKIRVLTSQGRLEAAVLVALPPLMFLVMSYLNPTYSLVLLDHPYPLMGVLAGMAVGILWIRRIVRFDF